MADVALPNITETTDPSNGILYIAIPSGGTYLDRFITYNNLLVTVNARLSALEGSSGAFTRTIYPGQSANFTDSITANYRLKYIDIRFISSSPVVSVGTTPAGTDLVDSVSPTISEDVNEIFNKTFIATTTLYFTITGGTVDISITYENNVFI